VSRAPLRVAGLLALLALCACYAPTVNRDRSYHPSDADLTVMRIVHASLVVDFRTTRMLVDPWFSPSPPTGQREPIGVPLDRVPDVRGILITHAHTDHFDQETLQNYPDKSLRVVTVVGLGARIRQMGYTDVVEIGAWERTQIGAVVITAVPASHGVPSLGFVLQGGGLTAYLAGDTLFDGGQFRAIAEAFPVIDVAVLPVGGIRVFGRRLDMNAREASRAVGILRPRRVIPSHYGLTGPFPIVLIDNDAASRFGREVGEAHPEVQVVVLEPGESWHHYR
jgi:L-ascorbate metabolism protein UlaG (beta-lactamase superfamily)